MLYLQNVFFRDMRSNYFSSTNRLGDCDFEESVNASSICYGSLARRGNFIEQVRTDVNNVLLLDSGDMEAGMYLNDSEKRCT